MRPFLAIFALAALLLSLPHLVHAQGTPGVEPNKCLAGKMKCVTKKIAGHLKCRELCQKMPDKKCGQAQVDCEQKVRDKFDGGDAPEKGCFAKLEAKGERDGAKPDQVCRRSDDSAEMEQEVDAAVWELIARLEGRLVSPGCPTACLQLIQIFAEHSFSGHSLSQPDCGFDQGREAGSVRLENLVSPHRDLLSVSAGRCSVVVGDLRLPGSDLLLYQQAACAPVAAAAVELVSGRTCDISAP